MIFMVTCKKCLGTLCVLLFTLVTLFSQDYSCRTGHVHILSSTTLMDVDADNYQVQSRLDASTGEVSFVGLSKSFEMKSGALDQAFNSKYVDVSGFSKFQYNGQISNLDAIDFNTPGNYVFKVSGILSLGDYKRRTSTNGKLIVNEDLSIEATSDFDIIIEQENVERINRILKERLSNYLSFSSFGISRTITIDVAFDYKRK